MKKKRKRRDLCLAALLMPLWLLLLFLGITDILPRANTLLLLRSIPCFALAVILINPLLKSLGGVYSLERAKVIFVVMGGCVLVSSFINACRYDEYGGQGFFTTCVYILDSMSVSLLMLALLVLFFYRMRVKKLKNMRKKIVAGNWKMNTTPAEGVALAKELLGMSKEVASDVTLIIAPPFTHLSMVENIIGGSPIALSSQDCADQAKGAYTGEVSVEMVAALGAKYVILGHSERREYYGENAETLNKKIKLVYANGLTPIFCVGEKKEERESGRHFDVCRQQIEEVVFNLTEKEFETLVIAYEPVWAIGTGLTATSDQAQEIHAFIREVLRSKFGIKAENTPILYGGSCKPSNAKDIFSKADVDGGLIGGAALVAVDFIGIAKSF